MKKSYLSIAASAALALVVMSGCSSSSDSAPVTAEATYTGIFVDNGTAGLAYGCKNGLGVQLSGTTDALGKFSGCGVSSKVAFSLGNLSLGSVVRPSNGVFTPTLLADASTLDAVQKQTLRNNIAATLLSMDSDPATPGIQLDADEIVEFNKVLPVGAEVSQPDVLVTVQATVAELVAAAIVKNPAIARTVVTPEAAELHIAEQNTLIDNGDFDQPAPSLEATPTGTGA